MNPKKGFIVVPLTACLLDALLLSLLLDRAVHNVADQLLLNVSIPRHGGIKQPSVEWASLGFCLLLLVNLEPDRPVNLLNHRVLAHSDDLVKTGVNHSKHSILNVK
jgi:hypothetical protein